tara:strand:- start:146 stop:619 length:474 start_codon:yes stop_codon:yes gene_type:complete
MPLWPPPGFLQELWKGTYSGEMPFATFNNATSAVIEPNKLIFISVLRVGALEFLDLSTLLTRGTFATHTVVSEDGVPVKMTGTYVCSEGNDCSIYEIIPTIALSEFTFTEENNQCDYDDLVKVENLVDERSSVAQRRSKMSELIGDKVGWIILFRLL